MPGSRAEPGRSTPRLDDLFRRTADLNKSENRMNDMALIRSILRDSIDAYLLDNPCDNDTLILESDFDQLEAIKAALDHFDDAGPQIADFQEKALLVMVRAELHRAINS